MLQQIHNLGDFRTGSFTGEPVVARATHVVNATRNNHPDNAPHSPIKTSVGAQALKAQKLMVIGRAFLLGCARKYVALFNHQGGSPITSLQYFVDIVEETAAMELNLNYWRYLAARVKKMDAQWRAQANFARAAPPKAEETK